MGNFEFITVKTLSLLGFGGATEILGGGLEPRSLGLAPPLPQTTTDLQQTRLWTQVETLWSRYLLQTRLIMFYKCLEVRTYRTLMFWLTSGVSICHRLKFKYRYYRLDLKCAGVSSKFPAP